MFRDSIAGAALALLAACGYRPPLVSSAPAGSVVMGDANGDGLADLSDAIYLESNLFRGGELPTCFGAADIIPDGEIEGADPFALLSVILPGDSDFPAFDATTCAGAAPPTVPAAATFGMQIDAPTKVKGPASTALSLSATVELYNPDRPVQGWTLSLAAEGCAIADLSTAGTDADFAEGAGGQRANRSYDFHAVTSDGGAVAGLILDWQGDTVLAAQDDPWRLMALTVTATPPASGCGTCTLRVKDGERAGGLPQRNAVTVGGWTYPIRPEEAEIKVCAR